MLNSKASRLIACFLIFFSILIFLYTTRYAFALSNLGTSTSFGGNVATYTIGSVDVTQLPKYIYENTPSVTLIFNIPSNGNRNTPYYILFWSKDQTWPAYTHCETTGSEFIVGGINYATGAGGWNSSTPEKCNWWNWPATTHTLVQDNTAWELHHNNNGSWSRTIPLKDLPPSNTEFKIWQGDVESSYIESQIVGYINIGQCAQAQNGCPSVAVDSYPEQYDTPFPLYIANPQAGVGYIVWWKDTHKIIWSGSFNGNDLKKASSFNVIGSNNSSVSVPAIKLQNNGQDVTQIVSSNEDQSLPTGSNNFKYKTLCLLQSTPQDMSGAISVIEDESFSINCGSTAKSTNVYFGINGQPLPSGTLQGNNNVGTPSTVSQEFNLQSPNSGMFLPCTTITPSPTPMPISQAYNNKTSFPVSPTNIWQNMLSYALFFFTGQSTQNTPIENSNQQLAYSQITPAQASAEFLMSTTNQTTTPISVGPSTISPGQEVVVAFTAPVTSSYTLIIQDGSNNSLLNNNLTNYCQAGKACDFLVTSNQYSNYKFTFPTNPQNFQIIVKDSNNIVGATNVAFTKPLSTTITNSPAKKPSIAQNTGLINIAIVGGAQNIYSDSSLLIYVDFYSSQSLKNCSIAITIAGQTVQSIPLGSCYNSPNSSELNPNFISIALAQASFSHQLSSITSPTSLSLTASAYYNTTSNNNITIKKSLTIYPLCGSVGCDGTCITVAGSSGQNSQNYCKVPNNTTATAQVTSAVTPKVPNNTTATAQVTSAVTPGISPTTYPTPENIGFSPCTQVDTAIGPIVTDPIAFVNKLFDVLLSLSGGIALLIIIYNGYRLMISRGNPDAIKKAREGITSGIIGIIFAILSIAILQTIGVDILHLPGFSN